MKLLILISIFYVFDSESRSFFNAFGIQTAEDKQWDVLADRGHQNPKDLKRYSFNPEERFGEFYDNWTVKCTRSLIWDNGYGTPNPFNFQKYYDDYTSSEGFKGLTKSCKKDLLYKYIENKAELLEDGLLTHEVCKNGCPIIESEVEKVKNTIYRLMMAVGDPVEQEVYCSYKSSESLVQELLDGKFEQLVNCAEVKVGQFKVVNSSDDDSVSAVQNAYTIDHKPDGYDILFDIEFKSKNASEIKKMNSTVEGCLNDFNSFLKTPDGKKVQLKLWASKDGVEKKPKTSIVNIVDESFRANSQSYPRDIGCSTVFHEVMHLAGFADEYEEKDELKDFSCRSHHQEPSIMANDTYFVQHLPQQVTCSCPDDNCQKILNNRRVFEENFVDPLPEGLSAISCNVSGVYQGDIPNISNHSKFKRKIKVLTNTNKVFRYSFQTLDTVFESNVGEIVNHNVTCQCKGEANKCRDELVKIREHLISPKAIVRKCVQNMKQTDFKLQKNSGSTHQYGNGKYTYTKKGAKDNLLRPIDYRKLLIGNCNIGVERFNKCSRYAYLSADDEECKDKPSYCNDLNRWTNVGVQND